MELWPEFNHKAALMRAYQAADKNKDGFVTRKEFGNDTFKPQTTQTWEFYRLMILTTNRTARENRRGFAEAKLRPNTKAPQPYIYISHMDVYDNECYNDISLCYWPAVLYGIVLYGTVLYGIVW
eukprot:COSAG06_NODE_5328_length_3552_cov_5.076417_2_plen_124_part_00